MCDPREEIEILLRYGKHPGIVTLKNVYEDSRKYYLVLQLLKGGDLLNFMMKRVRYEQKFTLISSTISEVYPLKIL